jgi:hypothetical protein
MDIKSLIERRNKTIVDAQALITKETVTTEVHHDYREEPNVRLSPDKTMVFFNVQSVRCGV